MWMYTLLPKIINMSVTASIVIVLVLLARIPLKKTPKIFSYALWAVVFFRLVCPVSFPSEFSLLGIFNAPPATNGTVAYIPTDIVHTEYPQIDLPIPIISKAINESLPQGEVQLGADPLEFPMAAATHLWLFGIAAMLIYSTVSLLLLRRKLIGAVRLRDNIYLADHIATPFVIGVIRPKIYLPSTLTEQEQSYIILHEQTHIRRLDHIFKMIAFLALAVHWFNPLVWVAFICAVKDMEMSCDERVLKQMGSEIKGAYSTSLLSLATGRRLINGNPLAFGEGNIKGRIKNVMNFKKPAFWVLIAATVAIIVAAVCLLTNPAKSLPDVSAPNTISSLAPAYAFDKSLYINPLSSYIPFGGTGQLYLFDPDKGFTIINEETGEIQERVSPINWSGNKVDTEEWNALFGIGEPIDISSYSVRTQYDMSDKYRVYQMDNEVWLASINAKEGMWSLYRLKETTPNPPITGLVEASQKVPFPIFIPTEVPDGLVAELTVDEGPPDFVRIEYRSKDGNVGLNVVNGLAGSGLALDPRKKGETIQIRSGIEGHYLINQPEFGGPILWWEEAGSYVALSGPELSKIDLVKIADSMSLTTGKSSWTPLIEADVTHDGIKETIYLDKTQMESIFDVTLRVLDSGGNEIWSESANTAHPGWNSLFLCEQDGESYLLRYRPTMYQGYGSYVYTLFTLEGGKEKDFRTATLEFDTTGTKELDTPKMITFADEVNALLGNSILLVSTDGGDFHFGPSSPEPFFERYSWLDLYPELFEAGDSLETQLNKYSEYAVSNYRLHNS